MRYALALLAVSLIVGGIAHANHLEPLAELATLGVLIALAALARNVWTFARGRRDQQREPL